MQIPIKKFIFIIFLLFLCVCLPFIGNAGHDEGGDAPPCVPSATEESIYYCHPVPLDENTLALIFLGLVLGIYQINKRNQHKKVAQSMN